MQSGYDIPVSTHSILLGKLTDLLLNILIKNIWSAGLFLF